MKTIRQQVQDLGWEMVDKEIDKVGWLAQDSDSMSTAYRAVQGGFTTPWRNTPDEVLADVKELSRVEKLLDKAEAKLAD